MKPKLGTFVTALLAGTFTTAAWAQDLGRVHFETSCTPQAQEKFDRGLGLKPSTAIPGLRRCRRALRWSVKRGTKQPRLSRGAASFHKPRLSPISPAPSVQPAAATLPPPTV